MNVEPDEIAQRLDPGEVARHDVGVALDHHGLLPLGDTAAPAPPYE